MMNDSELAAFDKLSFSEIKELQEKLEKYIQTRKDLRCYKVTFFIGFQANKHEHDSLCDPDVFGDYFANAPSNLMCKELGLSSPEDVSSCDVVELKPEEFPEMFRGEI